MGDQIEAVFFEQIPFVKFVSVHAAVLDLGHGEEAGSLALQVKVASNLDCFWRWDSFSTRFISSVNIYSPFVYHLFPLSFSACATMCNIV